ncbi:MAG: DegT/DnrJ/EryC1/StrS family aminotransferase [Vicinamibacteria bacterium]|nr:DegT/DnrJ/EryC1/StrS family aminotransferase [Vicinamibacteria bacterium]
MTEPILLSPPHLGTREQELVREAFASNWIAPVGPHVDAFEREFAARVGAAHAVALSSGTAALHLALELAGVAAGDVVLCSTLTFVASANPILYLGAHPVFVDSELESWNLDPALLAAELDRERAAGRRVGAVLAVHVFGQSANLEAVAAACQRHRVPLIEDAAEALGATFRGNAVGTRGFAGAFSFNGNKIITTSGGGMLVCPDAEVARRARFLATQAREAEAHYEHRTRGYNYRLSNVLAAIGRAQLEQLDDRVERRRENFRHYHELLAGEPGITFMPEAEWGRATRWLSVLLVEPQAFGATREDVRLHLLADGIEARPLWKPLHRQPLFARCRAVGGSVAEGLFDRGLCLPSGSQLTAAQRERVARRLLSTPRRGRR